VALIVVLDLLGVPVGDWIRDLFKKIREVPAWAVVAAIVLQSTQRRSCYGRAAWSEAVEASGNSRAVWRRRISTPHTASPMRTRTTTT
jgi:hypothetical protein